MEWQETLDTNNVRNDPEIVYARFSKYAKRFKDNHLKAYNITDKHQKRSLFLYSIGEATRDIFEQLDDTGTDLDGAITALLNKFKESQNRLFNIHKGDKGVYIVRLQSSS